jgi:hypothetical protein
LQWCEVDKRPNRYRKSRKEKQKSADIRQQDAPGHSGDAFRQVHPPPAFVSIHAENDGGFGGRVGDGSPQEQKIRAELANQVGSFADEQLHPDFGGMTGAAGRMREGGGHDEGR